MTPEARAIAGISDRLVRFSIGLENSQDLIRDIFRALDAVAAPSAANVAHFRKQSDLHAC
jgi:cystathionine gamma-synthase